jgi:SAM-dependent methyltransferase
MPLIDYKKNAYHKNRHPEMIANKSLQVAWSECAKSFYFNKLQDNLDIFEFGAGLGYNLFALSGNHNCSILEPSGIGRSNAIKFGIAAYKNVSEVKRKKFDIILCRHVLEHMPNPLDTLNTLKKMLKNNGYLILVLPSEGEHDKPIANEIDFHLYCWNPRTICNLLKYSGFTNSKYRYQFFNGRRFFLPIYKIFGPKIYIFLVELLGLITRSKEIVILCR